MGASDEDEQRGFRPRSEEVDIRPAVIAELAAAFGVDQGAHDCQVEPSQTLAREADHSGEFDLVDELEAELDPTAPLTGVISISDDEFVDPIYFDELGAQILEPPPRPTAAVEDSGGTSGRIVIVDGGEGDALVPDASGREGASRIEPRLRARRISVRRAEGRRRLRIFGVIGGLVLSAVIVLAVLGSPLFSIAQDDVVVTGAVYTDQTRLTTILDEVVGSATLLVNTTSVERRIEEIAWVEMARVRTSFPTGLRVEIRERRPLATYRGADGLFRVIDKEGRVLDVIEGQPIAYMLVFGLEELTLSPGQFTPPGPVGAAQLVQALTTTVRGRTQALEVDPNGEDLRMYLYRDAIYATTDPSRRLREPGPDFDPITAESIEVRFGGTSDLLLKLVRLETVLPVALEREVSFIDVSTATVTVR
jgi:cell division protein FtsQ